MIFNLSSSAGQTADRLTQVGNKRGLQYQHHRHRLYLDIGQAVEDDFDPRGSILAENYDTRCNIAPSSPYTLHYGTQATLWGRAECRP